LPSGCASKRSECGPPAANVTSIFHLPVILGDCAYANPAQHSWPIRHSVNSRSGIKNLTTNEHE
jgi:hypothetical protein